MYQNFNPDFATMAAGDVQNMVSTKWNVRQILSKIYSEVFGSRRKFEFETFGFFKIWSRGIIWKRIFIF